MSVYQVYKRQYKGGAEQSSCSLESAVKNKQDFSMENGGFEYDENGNTGAKLTHLWVNKDMPSLHKKWGGGGWIMRSLM